MTKIKFLTFYNKIRKNNFPLVIGYFGCIHVMHHILLTKYSNFNILTFKNIPNKTNVYSLKNRMANLQKYMPMSTYVLTDKYLKYSSDKFINEVLKKINPNKIIVGSDFKFGCDHASWTKLQKDFDVEVIPYNKHISTTKIYDLLKNHNIELANDYLAEPYYYSGKWVTGKKIGRKIGFKTINVKITELPCIPFGTYVTNVVIGKKTFKSISFLGQSLTFNRKQVVLENHIIDPKISKRIKINFKTFSNIKVEFLKFIRENKKFKSQEKLKKQIIEDFMVAKKFFLDINKKL